MKRIQLFASVLLLAAGCGVPPESIGESAEALTRQMLANAGAECDPIAGGEICVICYIVYWDGKQVGVCDTWYCETGVNECVYYPRASFDPGRTNVWLEGEAARWSRRCKR